MASTSLTISTFNMHGFRNGVSCVSNLCETCDLIAVEEHWLSRDKLNLLSTVHPDFVGYGVSGMNRMLQTKIYAGRPFGGVGLLWRRELSSRVKVITADVAGRCLAVQFDMCKDKSILIFVVYLPCFTNSSDYWTEVGHCYGFIESILMSHKKEAIIVGDFNFPCSPHNAAFAKCADVLNGYSIYNRDEVLVGDNAYSYVNESLGHRSLIDHIFMSDTLSKNLADLRIIDDPCNLSDHLPVVGKLMIDTHVSAQLHAASSKGNKQLFKTRWDKCNLNDYYCCTDTMLRNVNVPVECFVCPNGCECVNHRMSIDNYYNGIVLALQFAAHHTVPVMPCTALKAFWSAELDSLKSDSVFWHNVWYEAGRPSSGILHRIKTSCKLKYKLAIKEAFTAYDNANSDELAHHFLNKNIPDLEGVE